MGFLFMYVKKKIMYVLFVCRIIFFNVGIKCVCFDWWFINLRFFFVKFCIFILFEGGGVFCFIGIWFNLSEKKKGGGVVM